MSTKRTFNRLAKTINSHFDRAYRDAKTHKQMQLVGRLHMDLVRDLASDLASTNSRFDFRKFVEACGCDYNHANCERHVADIEQRLAS